MTNNNNQFTNKDRTFLSFLDSEDDNLLNAIIQARLGGSPDFNALIKNMLMREEEKKINKPKIEKTEKIDKIEKIENAKKEDFSCFDKQTTETVWDFTTSQLFDSIPSYEQFKFARETDPEVDKDELNNKVNFIVQYAFKTFVNKLNMLMNSTSSSIVITLQPPKYRGNEKRKYDVVLNRMAHEQAIQNICSGLSSKGFHEIQVNHESTSQEINGEEFVIDTYTISVEV